jgi:hypothetical protein
MMIITKAYQRDENPNIAHIEGVISTNHVDIQGESVSQDGLDFDYFLKKGFFNYEHKSGPENVLGYPTSVERRGDQTTVKGVLLLDRPLAKEIYATADAMRKAGSSRSLGFSIEGQVIERGRNEKNQIKKARVINVAITASPINPNTSLLLKALELVGHQVPSEPSPAGSLSALVPQQLDGTLSSADAQVLNSDDLARIIKELKKLFPRVALQKLNKCAGVILNNQRNLR